MTVRIAIHLLSAALAASLLAGCTTPLGSPTDQPALLGQAIIDRPNRLVEEQAAWNPKPISMDELIYPAIPLKESYPTLHLPPRVGSKVFWMDNRYAMIWAGGPKDKTTGNAIPYISILDTDSGEIFEYKAGRLVCYRNNHLVYETGSYKEGEQTRWSGLPGQEVELPARYTDKTDKGEVTRNYWVDERDCENKRVNFAWEKAEALFGRYTPKNLGEFQRPGTTYIRRSYWPLLNEHGFFSFDAAKNAEFGLKNKDRFSEITWFKPNGESMELELGPWSEVGSSIEAKQWSPFLGHYVFQAGIFIYGRPEGGHPNTVFFSPKNGSIVRIHRPHYLFRNILTTAVYATRAGLLWVTSRVGPQRGYYLSQGDTVKRIFDYEVIPEYTWVSPDGCKIMTYYDPSASSGPSRMAGPLGGMFDFSTPSSGRKHMAIINLCKIE